MHNCDAVEKHPKLFTGFSDTTVNHLMFYKLGLSTFYGPNFICDLGEISNAMLPYSKRAFESYLKAMNSGKLYLAKYGMKKEKIFKKDAIGTNRIPHKEEKGFELLQGKDVFRGGMLGGCLESFYDILTTTRYEDEKEVCEKYGIFPSKEEWSGKILFIETCERSQYRNCLKKKSLLLKI